MSFARVPSKALPRPLDRISIALQEELNAVAMSPALQRRLNGGLARAIKHPRGIPALRLTMRQVITELREQGMAENVLAGRLANLVELVALNTGCDGTSLATGRPRWFDIRDRVLEWVALPRGQH